MLAPANGFFGHIRNNHTRSLIMFAGFSISMQLAFAALLMFPIMIWGDHNVIFNDPRAYFSKWGLPIFSLSMAIFLVTFLLNTYIAKLATGFEYVDPIQNRRLDNIVKDLAWTAGITVPKMGIMYTPALNSFACGMTEKDATIIVTEGLLNELNDDELQAVIAHEIIHIKNGDISLMAAANASHSGIKMINWLNPFQMRSNKGLGCLVVLLPLFIILALVGAVISLSTTIASVSRYFITSSREFIADADAIKLTHNPAALVSALLKIEGRSSIPHLDAMSDSMMIDGPVNGEYASHPPIEDRVKALLQYGGSMVAGARISPDTRGFGQRRRPADVLETDKARQTYRAQAKVNIINRVSHGSNRSIIGLPKESIKFVLLAGAIPIALPLIMHSRMNNIASKIDKASPNIIQPIMSQSPVIVVLDLDGNGIATSRISQSRTYFDFNQDKEIELTGWISANDGFLVHDKNGNQKFDGLTELVSVSVERATANGHLVSLSRLDNNRDGLVNARDNAFSQLWVWRDLNRNGRFEDGEYFALSEYNISKIEINPVEKREKAEGYVLSTGAKIIGQSRYLISGPKSIKRLRGKDHGKIYQISFQTNLAHNWSAKIETMPMRPKYKNISSTIEMSPKVKIKPKPKNTADNAPKLRGSRSD